MTSIASSSAAPAGAPAAPAAPAARSRDRLLDAAADLFYREGVGVGVERICQTAGVSKRSMYQLFESKDAMIAESLRRFGARTTAHLLEADSVDDPPRERIMTVFQRLEDQTSGGSFAGCPFVSTAVELKDPTHRAVAVAVELKNQMTDFFADRARDAGVPGAADLAEALTAVFDGCAVRAVMRDAPLDGLAMRTAQAVLDSYGLTS